MSLHSCMNSFTARSVAMLYINKGSKPSCYGETFLDNPSNTTFIDPGICSVSASCAFKCIEIVVKMMLARLTYNELTLSDRVQAKELI